MEVIELPLMAIQYKSRCADYQKEIEKIWGTQVFVCVHTLFHMHRATGIESHRSTEIQMCIANTERYIDVRAHTPLKYHTV